MRKTIPVLGVLIVCITTIAPSVASADVEHQVLVDTRRHVTMPASTGDYLAWSTFRPTKDEQWVTVRSTDGTLVRLGSAGQYAYKPDVEGSLVAYSVFPKGGGHAAIRFFDLATGTAVEAPAGVNTGADEFWPSLSTERLMFARHNPRNGGGQLILLDLASGDTQVLATKTGWRRNLLPGQVSGDFAVWSRVAYDKSGMTTACDVYLHQISTGTTTPIPHKDRRCLAAASVDRSGTVYYGAAGMQCGHNAHLMSLTPGASPVSLVAFDPGTDIATTHAFDNADGTTTVTFDPGGCDGSSSQIWSVKV